MPYGFPFNTGAGSPLGAEVGKAITGQAGYQNCLLGSNDFANSWDTSAITAIAALDGAPDPGMSGIPIYPNGSVVGVRQWWELTGPGFIEGETDRDSAMPLCACPMVSVYVIAGDSDVAAIEYEFNGTTLWRLQFNPLNGGILSFTDPINASPPPIAETFVLGALVIHRFTFQAGQDDIYLTGRVRLFPADTGSVGTITYFQCAQVAAFYDGTGALISTNAYDPNPAYIDTQTSDAPDPSVASAYGAGPRFQVVPPMTQRRLGNAGGGTPTYTVDFDNDFGRHLNANTDDGTVWDVRLPTPIGSVADGSSIIAQGWYCYVGQQNAAAGESVTITLEGTVFVQQQGGPLVGAVVSPSITIPNAGSGDAFESGSGFVKIVYMGHNNGAPNRAIWLVIDCAIAPGASAVVSHGQEKFDTVGAHAFVVPAGITVIYVTGSGGGGGGGGGSSLAGPTFNGGGGAAAGEAILDEAFGVSPGDALTFTVGGGGAGGAVGVGAAAGGTGGTGSPSTIAGTVVLSLSNGGGGLGGSTAVPGGGSNTFLFTTGQNGALALNPSHPSYPAGGPGGGNIAGGIGGVNISAAAIVTKAASHGGGGAGGNAGVVGGAGGAGFFVVRW